MISDHCRRGAASSSRADRPRRDDRHPPRAAGHAAGLTHLLPATFGGAARFNIANALSGDRRRLRRGSPLHDIRQGLRTFVTSYYLSPGG